MLESITRWKPSRWIVLRTGLSWSDANTSSAPDTRISLNDRFTDSSRTCRLDENDCASNREPPFRSKQSPKSMDSRCFSLRRVCRAGLLLYEKLLNINQIKNTYKILYINIIILLILVNNLISNFDLSRFR